MKWIFITLSVLMLMSCTKELPGYYQGGNYVQFYYSYQVIATLDKDYVSSPYPYAPYISLSPTNLSDTVYFRLHITGEVSDQPRRVRLEQYKDSTNIYYLDPQPGVNYVAFDDPIMQEALTIPGDSAYVNIPIIVKYDPATAGTYQSFQF